MVDMPKENDPLWMLLQRAVEDDGVEGDFGGVAFGIFRRRVKGRHGRIFFITDDDDDPLMPMIRDLQSDLNDARAEIAMLRRQMHAKGITPKKEKATSFPWDRHSDLEIEAFKMIFIRQNPMSVVKEFIRSRASEAKDNSTFLNQRFVQGRPDSLNHLIEVKGAKDGTKTSWAELWKIGTVQHAESWIQRVMREGGGWDAFADENGHVPKDWSQIDPNSVIDEDGRRKLRHLYATNGFNPAGEELLHLVAAAGPGGITQADLKKKGISGRRFDIAHKSLIFKDEGRWYHYRYGSLFPGNADARVAVAKFPDEQVAFEKVALPGEQVHTEASTV